MGEKRVGDRQICGIERVDQEAHGPCPRRIPDEWPPQQLEIVHLIAGQAEVRFHREQVGGTAGEACSHGGRQVDVLESVEHGRSPCCCISPGRAEGWTAAREVMPPRFPQLSALVSLNLWEVTPVKRSGGDYRWWTCGRQDAGSGTSDRSSTSCCSRAAYGVFEVDVGRPRCGLVMRRGAVSRTLPRSGVFWRALGAEE